MHRRPIALLVLALAGSHAAVGAQRPVPSPLRIVLVGDSTVAAAQGWGPGFCRLLLPGVECLNRAANGRSSKSFFDEGRWREALALKGTHYLIQFGHNDEPGKGPDRETDPRTTYRQYMSRYIDDARAIGATPVLVTSLTRRRFDDAGRIVPNIVPYVDAVRRLAVEKHVPLIDLHVRSAAAAERMGDAAWAALSPRDSTGEVDRTHLNAKGGALVGAMVAAELKNAVPALAPHIRTHPLALDDASVRHEGQRAACPCRAWRLTPPAAAAARVTAMGCR